MCHIGYFLNFQENTSKSNASGVAYKSWKKISVLMIPTALRVMIPPLHLLLFQPRYDFLLKS